MSGGGFWFRRCWFLVLSGKRFSFSFSIDFFKKNWFSISELDYVGFSIVASGLCWFLNFCFIDFQFLFSRAIFMLVYKTEIDLDYVGFSILNITGNLVESYTKLWNLLLHRAVCCNWEYIYSAIDKAISWIKVKRNLGYDQENQINGMSKRIHDCKI